MSISDTPSSICDKMTPLTMDYGGNYSCCMCEELLFTIRKLHYHQTHSHTTEELSFALLASKGLDGYDVSCKEPVECSCSDTVLLHTRLPKSPRLADSTKEDTGHVITEITKTSGKISSLDSFMPLVGIKSTETNIILAKNNHDEEDIYESGTSTTKEDEKYMTQVGHEKCSSTKEEGEMLLDTSIGEQETGERDSETDSDIECEEDLSSSGKHGTDACNSLPTLKEAATLVSNTSIPRTPPKSKSSSNQIQMHNNTSKTNFLNEVDMVCSNESSKSCSTLLSETLPKNENQSFFPPSYVDTHIPSVSLAHLECHTQAVISESLKSDLPADDDDDNSSSKNSYSVKRSLEENFILASPMPKKHQNDIPFACNCKTKNSSTTNIEGGDFHEYFVPCAHLEPSKDYIDVSCGTNEILFKEKQVQTNFVIVHEEAEYEENLQAKTDISTQTCYVVDTGMNDTVEPAKEPNPNVQKLVLFRKSKLKSKCASDVNGTSLDCESNEKPSLKEELPAPVPESVKNIPPLLNKEISPIDTHYTFPSHNRENSARAYPVVSTDRRFFCELCGKGYKKKSHLERHLRVHTGERPFSCSFCEKRFAVRSILKQHIRVHTGEKPYSCTICSQRFPQKSGLMTHMMLHTGKPFKCDQCEKSFVSNHKLLHHLRCHDSHNLHICDECNMELVTARGLLEHTKSHVQTKLFSCSMCGESFGQEIALKLHLREH